MNPIDKRIALDKFPLRMAARSSTPPAPYIPPESTHGLDAALDGEGERKYCFFLS